MEVSSSSAADIAKVTQLYEAVKDEPQLDLHTNHVLHGGMYTRTLFVPKGVLVVGALIKVATMLIVQGDVLVYTDGQGMKFTGYNVLSACAGRKQAVFALEDAWFTTVFPTQAKTVDEAEREFTDEFEMLRSRMLPLHNFTLISGE